MDKLNLSILNQKQNVKIEKNWKISTENDGDIVTSDKEYNCYKHGIKSWLLILIKNRAQLSSVSAG